ncbi:N-acetylneuraminate synthase family protein [Candidatus Omnitrophota bacterium]
MKIENFEIGRNTFIIAEIGGNHNGDLDTAKELIKLAKASGADAVKFQTFDAAKYIDAATPAMALVRKFHKTQQERYKSLQFTPDQWELLVRYCRELGIIFFSTPADSESADLLDRYVSVFKIQSGDATNIPLIRHVAKKGKPVIMSTGMVTEAELKAAVGEIPKERLILLHCVSIYPTPPDRVSLLSIPYLQKAFGVPVGYSDHTEDSMACLSAVALGAVVIERHFTNDKTQPIGDHKFSADPEGFKGMVEQIRRIEKMRGGFETRLSDAELKMRSIMWRGLSIKEDIPAGTVLTEDLLIPLRPWKGIQASRIDSIIGRKTKKDLKKGDFLEEVHIG